MKEYWDNSNFNRHKQREKSKRHALHKVMSLFLIACCCLTVFAIGMFVRNSPLSIDNQPNISFASDAIINTDFSLATIDATQSNDGEPASIADAHNRADEEAWNLILVNRWNSIPDNYEMELTELTNGQLIDKRIYPALQDMFDSARGDGIYPVVVSGYRTAETQQRLLDEKIAEYRAEGCSVAEAITKAEAWVAIPGTSEHQLGIAVDINADGIHSAGYEVYTWLEQNAHKYGFICRYPTDKTEITGVTGEAWHYRYVGIPAAAEIHNQGICLEEYLNSTN